jgi:DNA-binding MarR family transcriptional regulator
LDRLNKDKLDDVSEKFLKVFPVIIKYFILLGDKCADPKYSYQDYQTLHVLKESGRVPISTVGATLLISKSRMTAIVDKLIGEGLLERYPDKKDRRIINVGLTEKGMELTLVHKQNLKEGIFKRFGSLNDDEMDRFINSMVTMQEIMKKTKEEWEL